MKLDTTLSPQNTNMRKQLDNLNLSRFVYLYKFDREICIYHSLLIKKIFLSDLEFSSLESNVGLRTELYKEGFLVKEGEDELLYKKAKEKVVDWRLKTLFLVVTNNCNFGCKYCFENLKKCSEIKNMDEKTAKGAIDSFVNETSNLSSPKSIFFYGGECLLNFKVIKKAVEYIDNLKNEDLIKDVNIDIITNGSLINEEIIDFAKKYDISFGISLDGFKDSHNKMRVYKDNKGTYEDVIRGINLLKKNNIDYTILCTVGTHNIKEIDKICEFFIKDLDSKKINLNLPLCKKGEGYPFEKEIPINLLLDKLFEAFKVIRENGAYEGTLFKHLISFVEEELFRGECDGFGSQIVVSPEGRIGPCIALVDEDEFSIKNNLSDFNIKKQKLFIDFAENIALNDTNCKNCPALGICGGGCLYNKINEKRKLQKNYHCDFMLGLLKNLISELKDRNS